MDYTKYIDWLKTNLTEERYEHSLGTAECARDLAERFGLDTEKAYLCGLIHDCAKCFSNLDLREKICDCNWLCEGEIDNPKTYHAPAGAILAKEELGICDEEIISATRWHTIGKINMTDFEKIIFIADKIEKRTRPIEYREPIEKALESGLDEALLVCYKNTIKSLVDRNLTICFKTIEIYNNLLNNLDSRH
ncbi:bis(5'-nucleosyl)-tetraphosphatase (symmetrical) YqeK [bacterium]|nr:bis(5'-nucleosyl)-tetraphosphatase (symmetrical) YqeK [bacterium]